jgi:hypothetical protein
MKTTRFRPISESTSSLRVLRDVKLNEESETCSYVKLGVRKTISGERFRDLMWLLTSLQQRETNNSWMAIGMKCKATGMKFVVMDQFFYAKF